ncbi:MAG: M20 family metallopeptidase [Nitrolancea sp.]
MATKEEIQEWLDEREGRFVAVADEIWRKPQLGLAETEACALHTSEMEKEGFRITPNIGGMPTAFMAEWGSGSPIIGFLGEYDALPGLSQKLQATQDPDVDGGPGHGCGHNLLGTAALAATMSVKAWMEQTGQQGTVRYYGCPAEETLIGKTYMARAGVFDDLDSAITWHPSDFNNATKSSCNALDNTKFRFHGKTAHAGGNPEQGRSALDAVELMNVGVNYMREHVIQEARIHYVITNGGGAPNVVPDRAEVWYYVRAPHRYQVDELTARVRDIAKGAALMTGTTLEEDMQGGCYDVLPNNFLADLAQSMLHEIGPIEYSAEEKSFAKTVMAGFPPGTCELNLRARNMPDSMLDEPLHGEIGPIYDEGHVSGGSTDVGDVSYITPTVQVHTTCHPTAIPGHSWGITATAGMSIGHKGMMLAAKAMALTGVALYQDPSLIEQAQAEFKEKTGGQPYKTPLAEGLQPPVPKHVLAAAK